MSKSDTLTTPSRDCVTVPNESRDGVQLTERVEKTSMEETSRTGNSHKSVSNETSQSRDDESRDCGLTCADVSVSVQTGRQLVTLPAALLSHVNPSLPICLSLTHASCQLTVPADNIYRSTAGLRLLLPADSLPPDYVGGRQLACTLGRQSQLISVSLAVH